MDLEVQSALKPKKLTRDQRFQMHTVIDIEWNPRRIANLTPPQAQYARLVRITPQKQRCGPKPMLDTTRRKAPFRIIQS